MGMPLVAARRAQRPACAPGLRAAQGLRKYPGKSQGRHADVSVSRPTVVVASCPILGGSPILRRESCAR